MSLINMQWWSEKKALDFVSGKPCRICGQPSCCAVRDWGISPACMMHGREAEKLGYIVAFPDPPIKDGEPQASLDVTASNVTFLSAKGETEEMEF